MSNNWTSECLWETASTSWKRILSSYKTIFILELFGSRKTVVSQVSLLPLGHRARVSLCEVFHMFYCVHVNFLPVLCFSSTSQKHTVVGELSTLTCPVSVWIRAHVVPCNGLASRDDIPASHSIPLRLTYPSRVCTVKQLQKINGKKKKEKEMLILNLVEQWLMYNL